MALNSFQRNVCRLLAANRVSSGESYLAGGATLNELLAAPRLSRDLDVFHDTEAALTAAWEADRALLEGAGYQVAVFRNRLGLVEAEVRQGPDVVRMEWARDSVFRFFPLVEHSELGLVLHPFDLATSKVLALVGRVEVRDFIDTLTCDRLVQPLGYLAWAACGKDPGFSPSSILEEAARTGRYSEEEIRAVAFEGSAPDPGELSRTWRSQLAGGREIVGLLPPAEAGKAVLDDTGRPFCGDASALRQALAVGQVTFHPGSIRGALPRLA